jgi:hypothetical protein
LFEGVKGIFLKFDHLIFENDTSPFGKGGSRGIFQVDSLSNPPWPPFSKGGNPFDFSCDCSMKFKNDTGNLPFLLFVRHGIKMYFPDDSEKNETLIT